MKTLLSVGFKYLAVLLLLAIAILAIRSAWPVSGREAMAKSAPREVLPDAALQRQKILEELQLIRQRLTEIQQDLKSGNITFTVVKKANPAAGSKPPEKTK